MQYIYPQAVLHSTNGGLDIILMLYPDALQSVKNRNHKFKTRDEKTASASLKQNKSDGNWLVTDFGGDQKPRNGIGCYMHEKNVDYAHALNELAELYQVTSEEQAKSIHKADYTERPANTDEPEGQWNWNIREDGSFTNLEIETIFSKNVLAYAGWYSNDENKRKAAYTKLRTALQKYRFYPIVSYWRIKDRKAKIFSSTEHYPIFLIDEGTHQKIYQPKNPDKQYRFMYAGTKPKDFIHGLDQLETEYKRKAKEIEDEKTDMEEMDSGSEGEPIGKSEKKSASPKLDQVIICSGGSDAVNLAALGYWVLWLNSETAKLQGYQYKNLGLKCKEIFQLNDIDRTGKRASHEMAMEYLDIKTIELPEELKRFKDNRRNECKDLRDYLDHYTEYNFKKLVETALPYRFWEKKAKYAGKGEHRVFIGFDYEFDNVQAYNFLAKNGYYRLRSESKKSGWLFIKIQGNTIIETDPNEVKNFIHTFLKLRMEDKALKNAMFRTPYLSESSLSNIDLTEIDFTDFDKQTQYLFFDNKTLQITAEGIKDYKPGEIEKYIWQEEVINHRLDLAKAAPFTITRDELGTYDIEISNKSCHFLNYLIQTSRVHWRTEMEEKIKALPEMDREAYRESNKFNIAGSLLDQADAEEQKRHLINKLFCIGYLLHRHKDPSRPWCVFAMDNKINDDGMSHGGSGKSILFNTAIRKVLKKSFYLGGRNPRLTENPHIYDGLTEHHRYILIDDANEYLKFDFFFDALTGEIKVNPKNVQAYVIPFEKAGKFAITSNFTLKKIDPSTERRILYAVFSDYYHTAGESTDYREQRDPKSEIGKNLFSEFTEEEYNHFYNTMIWCLHFYLNATEKIGPAMSNVTKRNLLSTMGNNFHDWALAYFHPGNGTLDSYVVREEAFSDFKRAHKGDWTAQNFLERVKAFCRYYGYILNPVDLRDKTGRIMRKTEKREWSARDGRMIIVDDKKVTKEHLYIQTRQDIPIEIQAPLDEDEKLPF